MAVVRTVIRRAGLLPAAHALRRAARLAVDPSFRAEERTRAEQFAGFRREYGGALGHSLNGTRAQPQPALVASIGFVDGAKMELGVLKALQLAGFEPVVLTAGDPWLARYYRLAGVRRMLAWDGAADPAPETAALETLEGLRSFEELLSAERDGIRVGRLTASTAFRHLRVGSLDLGSADIRRRLAPHLARAMRAATAARRIVRRVRPAMVVLVDKGYTPQGELFDAALSEAIPVITWNAAHRGNRLLLKRYTGENRDEHHASLSPESWERVRRMPWTEAERARLRQELHESYATGEWYSEAGTQFSTRIVDGAELRRRLGLDPAKRTAVIFPHILWDGTFFWGTDLFRTYEEWVVEAVRAACQNAHVNWIIKVHPANVVKNARDGVAGEPAELLAISRAVGALPPHVRVLPAETDINTYSLFGVMDYCLTVRGTIGIEAASFGIPVLTAGTGRYDHRGFTIDSASREEYLERLRTIHTIPRLSPAQQELAERFAYGTFLLRVLPLSTVTFRYARDAKATLITEVHARSQADWRQAHDLRAFSAWLKGDAADFLTGSC